MGRSNNKHIPGYIIWNTVSKGENNIPEYYVALVYFEGEDKDKYYNNMINSESHSLNFFKNAMRNNHLMIDELDFYMPRLQPNEDDEHSGGEEETYKIKFSEYMDKANNKIVVKMPVNCIFGEEEIYASMENIIVQNGHDPKQIHLNIAIQSFNAEYIDENIPTFERYDIKSSKSKRREHAIYTVYKNKPGKYSRKYIQ